MSERREKKIRQSKSRSRSRSRSRSHQRRKSQKQKYKKNKRSNRSYSRSSSSSCSSRSPKHQRSPSSKKSYSSKYDKKSDKYSPETHHETSEKIDTDGYRPQQSESNCLVITDLNEDTTQDELEDLLQDIAINFQTSPPESIQLVSVLKTAYAVFPSVDAAKKILYGLRGKLEKDKVKLSLEFFPTSLTNQKQPAPSKDVNLVQDWICDKCEYKNFAKRGKCNKCENPRNSNCKVVYNSACYVKQSHPSQSSSFFSGSNVQDSSNNSLMVRGNVLQEISETELLDFFHQFAQVKDIRMVRNKNTGKYRDFAFIEFFSVDEAERVLKSSQEQDFRIHGQSLTLAFSRSKRRDEDQQTGAEDTSPHVGFSNRQYYGTGTTTAATYGSDVSFTNLGQDGTSTYYGQNTYNQQYYPQQYNVTEAYNAASTNMQYMQNYNTMYNYNQVYAQGYTNQSYANYGYDTQNYARQNYNQQLQQQLQPSIIAQTIQQQQTNPQTPLIQQQPQTILTNLGGVSMASSQSSQPLIQIPQQQIEKKQTHEIKESEQKETDESKEIKMVEEPTNIESSNRDQYLEEEKTITKENEDISPKPIQTEAQDPEKKKNIQNPKLSKADEEKAKRKQIELEMKKWEREQQIKTGGGMQEEQEHQSQHLKKETIKGLATQESEKLAPIQVQNKKNNVFSKPESSTPIEPVNKPQEIKSYKVLLKDVIVCKLCQRKFNDDYSINLHERFSQLHKDNLKALSGQ